ncbi:MAG: lipopolysaccharide transport periplasmic protein LptA [Gallionella sp.]
MNRASLLFALLSFVLAAPCLAERADRDKPAHIEADQMLVDDAKQVSTFVGNVQFNQGTMLIRGDKIVVTQDKEGFRHAAVFGKPASFRQKREGLDEYVEGYGERIEHDARAETLDFYVKARVVRERDEVRGDHITYSQKTEVFQVSSGSAGADGASSKRVRAVLQPKARTGAASSPSEALPIAPSTTLTPMEQE